ncbi:MAG: TraR/DksA C4-type zinc finger protein [Gammaproteobacteria bacterium]|nr:TraR/DksA C4-type zinc finger protein [Gammaproteobacteria bacterium]MDH5591256.1 TraR/DksA C4-type zinc finger protein [Gammaproteobacteria bacterium]
MNDSNLHKFKHLLEQQRDELLVSQQMAQSSTEPVQLDQASVGRVSRMDALQSQSMAVETTRLRQQQLRKITTALALIDSGDYGFCSVCDSEIDPRRLDIDPASSMCVSCASKQE